MLQWLPYSARESSYARAYLLEVLGWCYCYGAGISHRPRRVSLCYCIVKAILIPEQFDAYSRKATLSENESADDCHRVYELAGTVRALHHGRVRISVV